MTVTISRFTTTTRMLKSPFEDLRLRAFRTPISASSRIIPIAGSTPTRRSTEIAMASMIAPRVLEGCWYRSGGWRRRWIAGGPRLTGYPGARPGRRCGLAGLDSGWSRCRRCNRRHCWGLTQAGISKEDAPLYAEGVRRGGTLVSARVPDADRARLRRHTEQVRC